MTLLSLWSYFCDFLTHDGLNWLDIPTSHFECSYQNKINLNALNSSLIVHRQSCCWSPHHICSSYDEMHSATTNLSLLKVFAGLKSVGHNIHSFLSTSRKLWYKKKKHTNAKLMMWMSLITILIWNRANSQKKKKIQNWIRTRGRLKMSRTV